MGEHFLNQDIVFAFLRIMFAGAHDSQYTFNNTSHNSFESCAKTKLKYTKIKYTKKYMYNNLTIYFR